MLSFLKKTFERLLDNQDCALIEFNAEEDHVHLLIEVHPSIQPAKMINSLKTTSSRLIKKDFGERLKKYCWGTNAIWSRSYCLLSVGSAPLSVLKEYIENQKSPED
jgi:putative transposase